MKRKRLLPFESFYQVEGELGRFEGETCEKGLLQVLPDILSKLPKVCHLDVGCAGGYCNEVVAEKPCCSLSVGVDVSRAKLFRGCKRIRKVNVGFVCASWDFLPFKPKQFSLITFFDGIEHALNPKATIEEINKFLMQNGFLIVSCPVSTPILVIPEMLEVELNRLLLVAFGRIFRGHLNWFVKSKILKQLEPHFRVIYYSTDIPARGITKQVFILITVLSRNFVSYLTKLMSLKIRIPDGPQTVFAATIVSTTKQA